MGLDREATIARLKDLHGAVTMTLNNEDADRQATLEDLDAGLFSIITQLTETEDVVIDLAFVLQLGAPVDRAACVICGLCTRSECGFHSAPQQRCEGHETPDPNPMPPAECKLCSEYMIYDSAQQKYVDAMSGSLHCAKTADLHIPTR